MRTTTVGDVRILLPDLDPEDLDSVTQLADGLTEAFVEGASWRGVQLEDCSISGSRITGGDLSESTWEAGSLYGCEITRTDFSGATLVGVTIERCAITGSRFTGIRLTDVRLKDVLFDGCRFDYATFQRVTVAGSVSFTDCVLAHGTWSTCRLPESRCGPATSPAWSWTPANSTALTCGAAASRGSRRHLRTCPASPSPRASFLTSPSWPWTPWV
jgi:hypothetical protein